MFEQFVDYLFNYHVNVLLIIHIAMLSLEISTIRKPNGIIGY